jgi:hypothetical protein
VAGETQMTSTTAPAGAPAVAPAPAPAAAPAAAPTTLLGTPPAPAATEAPAGEKKPEGAAPAPAAAAELELKLPAGFDPKDAMLGEFKGVAKELGLKSEQAQKIFDLYAKSQEPMARALGTLYSGSEGWVEGLKKDPEFGGANFDKSARMAAMAVAKFGGEPLRELFDSSGLGNHPALVKTFAAIGKALAAEDSVAGSSSQGTAPAADPLAVMFPSMFKK